MTKSRIETNNTLVDQTLIETNTYKVQFISTLVCPAFRHFAGDIVNLNEEDYQLALKYKSIKEL